MRARYGLEFVGIVLPHLRCRTLRTNRILAIQGIPNHSHVCIVNFRSFPVETIFGGPDQANNSDLDSVCSLIRRPSPQEVLHFSESMISVGSTAFIVLTIMST